MTPVQDLLDYYIGLAKAHDFFLITFIQRQIMTVLILHDFFSNTISMIDVCTLSQYLAFEADENKTEESDLEYILWCCSELIPTEDQSKVYDLPQRQQVQLLAILERYMNDNIEIIASVIIERTGQKLRA